MIFGRLSGKDILRVSFKCKKGHNFYNRILYPDLVAPDLSLYINNLDMKHVSFMQQADGLFPKDGDENDSVPGIETC